MFITLWMFGSSKGLEFPLKVHLSNGALQYVCFPACWLLLSHVSCCSRSICVSMSLMSPRANAFLSRSWVDSCTLTYISFTSYSLTLVYARMRVWNWIWRPFRTFWISLHFWRTCGIAQINLLSLPGKNWRMSPSWIWAVCSPVVMGPVCGEPFPSEELSHQECWGSLWINLPQKWSWIMTLFLHAQ